jgi:hypothetical protein
MDRAFPGARWVAAYEPLRQQALRAMEPYLDSYSSSGRASAQVSRKQAEASAAAARDTWERWPDELLPGMERAAALATRFAVIPQLAAYRSSAGSSTQGGPGRLAAGAAAAAAAGTAAAGTAAAGTAAGPGIGSTPPAGRGLGECSGQHGVKRGSSQVPLALVQRELALSGLTCAHPGCANLAGPSEAELALHPCRGCRVACYCRCVVALASPIGDWSRSMSSRLVS